jgi:hypothetical protein
MTTTTSALGESLRLSDWGPRAWKQKDGPPAVIYYGDAEPGDVCFADVVAIDSEIIRVLAMRYKKDDPPNRPAAPCRMLTAAERAEVEKQLRDRGLLRAATQDEINEMKMRRRASSSSTW